MSKYTRQHYVQIAAVLGRHKPEPNVTFCFRNTYADIINSFCILFEADTPRFDRAKFLTAVGYNPEAKS